VQKSFKGNLGRKRRKQRDRLITSGLEIQLKGRLKTLAELFEKAILTIADMTTSHDYSIERFLELIEFVMRAIIELKMTLLLLESEGGLENGSKRFQDQEFSLSV
jgi:hypothetical protein